MENDKYIGQLVDGRYEILEAIGTGGMAVVYKAKCHRLNRLVAIKILKDDYYQDEEFRRRFHAESQAVAMLSHPNIVSVYDVSSSDEADYIIMELIDGITLKQYMEKKGVLNWKETLHFAMQIAKALEHAHGRGIVHRDIKPHNVMVLKNGSVKVADFGIAQVTSNACTMTKEALGSVHYISPEQAKGGRVDNRSDLYSLGVVMYEMITGRVPYDGDNPVGIAIQHINGGAAAPTELNPGVPRGLEQIIQKAMAHMPRNRYLTATAMLYDMDEFRKEPTIVFPEPAEEMDSTRVLPADIQKEAAAQADLSSTRRTVVKPPPGGWQTPRRVERELPEEDVGRSRMATMAIASCVVVGIVAIIIFLVVMLQGTNDPSTKVQVPSLVGRRYEDLGQFPGVVVIRQNSAYSSEFEKGQIMQQSPKAGDKVASGSKVFVTVSLGEEPPSRTMKELAGEKLLDAISFLESLDLNLDIREHKENSREVANGQVIRTDPAAGEVLSQGQTVVLYYSIGPKVVTAKLPNVVGMDVELATKTLNYNQFYDVKTTPIDSTAPRGTVVKQSLDADRRVDVTTQIVLYVSTGVAPDETNDSTAGVNETGFYRNE
jgi:serine/threonine-protein kinase